MMGFTFLTTGVTPENIGTFIVGAGGLGIAAGLLKISFALGRLSHVLDDHENRLGKVEDTINSLAPHTIRFPSAPLA